MKKQVMIFAVSILVMLAMPACSLRNISSTPTLVSDSAKATIMSPSYMEECKWGNLYTNNSRAKFLGLYPSATIHQEDVINRIGDPVETATNNFDKSKQWSYDGFDLYFEPEKLSLIRVFSKKYMLALEELLKIYGCPDVVFALGVGVPIEYSAITISYYKFGVEVLFESLPASYQDKSTLILYTQPYSDLETYLNDRGAFYIDPYVGKVITWKEAVAVP